MVFHDILLRLGLDPKDFSVRGSILCDAWTGSFSKARGFDVRRCLVGYLIGELTAVKFFPRNFQSSQMYILWINTVWAFKMNPFWSNRSLERRQLCAMFVWRWFHFPQVMGSLWIKFTLRIDRPWDLLTFIASMKAICGGALVTSQSP